MCHELRHGGDELSNGLRSFRHVDCRGRLMQQRVHDATARLQAELPALSDRRESKRTAEEQWRSRGRWGTLPFGRGACFDAPRRF